MLVEAAAAAVLELHHLQVLSLTKSLVQLLQFLQTRLRAKSVLEQVLTLLQVGRRARTMRIGLQLGTVREIPCTKTLAE